jgi:hypothetical protein
MAGQRSTGIGDVYTPVTLAAGSQSAVVASGYGALLGWTAAEMAGNAASFRLHDGASMVGPSQCLTSLVIIGPSQSTADWYGPQGIAVASCIGVERVAGITEITIYGA